MNMKITNPERSQAIETMKLIGDWEFMKHWTKPEAEALLRASGAAWANMTKLAYTRVAQSVSGRCTPRKMRQTP
jgi:hypothetical protein